MPLSHGILSSQRLSSSSFAMFSSCHLCCCLLFSITMGPPITMFGGQWTQKILCSLQFSASIYSVLTKGLSKATKRMCPNPKALLLCNVRQIWLRGVFNHNSIGKKRTCISLGKEALLWKRHLYVYLPRTAVQRRCLQLVCRRMSGP